MSGNTLLSQLLLHDMPGQKPTTNLVSKKTKFGQGCVKTPRIRKTSTVTKHTTTFTSFTYRWEVVTLLD